VVAVSSSGKLKLPAVLGYGVKTKKIILVLKLKKVVAAMQSKKSNSEYLLSLRRVHRESASAAQLQGSVSVGTCQSSFTLSNAL
jgi:hypothetical protein